MKKSVSSLKNTIWRELHLSRRSVTFTVFITEYGNGIMAGYVKDVDEMFDSDDWYDFCLNKVPNTPAVDTETCVTYMLGDGDPDILTGGELDFLTSMLWENPDAFLVLMDMKADVLHTICDKSVPNPAYDVLGNIDDEEE